MTTDGTNSYAIVNYDNLDWKDFTQRRQRPIIGHSENSDRLFNSFVDDWIENHMLNGDPYNLDSLNGNTYETILGKRRGKYWCSNFM